MNIENLTFGVEIETTIPIGAGICVGGYHAGAPVTTAHNPNAPATITAPNFNGRVWKAERDGLWV